jgi:hypothetical protein
MKKLQKYLQNHGLLVISVLVFIIFFSLAILKPKGIFWSLDEGGKWIYMENVLRTGSPRAPLIYPGRSLDSKLENVALFFYGRIGQKIYTWWPVGFPLVTLPFYKLLGWAGLFILPSLAGAIIVYFSGKIAETFSSKLKNSGRLIALTIALATPVAFYSMTFWEHTISVACVVITLYCIQISIRTPERPYLFIAGVMGSLATFFRLESGLIILGFGVAILVFEMKKAIPLILGGLITTSGWVLGNMWLSGHPFSSSMDSIQAISSFTAFKMVGIRFISYVLFNSPTIGAFDLGDRLLYLVTFLTGLCVLFGIFRKTLWLSALLSVSVTGICAYVLFQPSLYRSVHGFVLISPIVLLSSWIIGTQAWRANKKFWIICGMGLIVFTIGYVLRAWVSAGGLQWGPRYMLALYPILVIAAVIGAEELLGQVSALKRYLVLAVAAVAVLVGFGFEVRGYITMYLTMDLYNKSATTLRAINDKVIKTECTWMPMVIPDLYWKGNIFTNTYSENWENNVKKSGQNSYLFVTMHACDTDPIDQELKRYATVKDGLDIKVVYFSN